MSTPPSNPKLEEVLDAFAVEQEHGRETLEGYVRRFPQFAAELVDLSRELLRDVSIDTSPLSESEEAQINAAWRVHVAARPPAAVDPFASIDVAMSRHIAKTLGVPRQVITAFRERRVNVASVPRRFLRRIADSIGSTFDELAAGLALPLAPRPARSYRSDDKPTVQKQISFEQVLIDAGVSEDERAALMAEGE
jgi:hypothetical protein